MPTPNPRITITLKPGMHALLRRISDLSGNSMSAMVSEFLEEAEPALERMAALLSAVESIKGDAEAQRKRITSNLSEAQSQMEQQLGLALSAMDEASAPILKEAERIKRRAARAGRDASAARPDRGARGGSTPLSNRGVRFPRKAP